MKKTVLITGANRGIGLGLVKEFLKNDYRVIATCRQPSKAELLNEIARENTSLHIYQLDVNCESDFIKLKQELKDIGIDTLIANAGIKGYDNPERRTMAFWEFTSKEMNAAYETNVTGAHMTIKTFLPLVNQSQDRAIFAMGSGIGSIADNQSGGSAPYRCSKSALHQLIETVDRDCRNSTTYSSIIAATLIPGFVKTDMGGPNARLTVEECCSRLYQRIQEVIESRETNKLIMHDRSAMPF
ncbi:SDR family oxidoreductase [Legionella dresdenensis]|uniref:SDR family oxidoreductase n=1 Tax=Legionella dresdenensis TaxID=450200 RepID=A0ABV8CH85_9GAMM